MPRTGAIVALISTFGALNGWILLQGRVPPAAAEDGIFPPQFAKVHGKRRTPVFGLVVPSVLVSGRRRSPRAPTAGRSRR